MSILLTTLKLVIKSKFKMLDIQHNDYKNWIVEIKSKIRSAQAKAALAVNTAVIDFYWDLGKMIAEKQTAWGTKFLDQLSKDLQAEFPEMKDLSTSNLKYCRSFYLFYQNVIGQQAVDQLQNYERQLDTISQQLVDQLKKISPQVEDEFILNSCKRIWKNQSLS